MNLALPSFGSLSIGVFCVVFLGSSSRISSICGGRRRVLSFGESAAFLVALGGLREEFREVIEL